MCGCNRKMLIFHYYLSHDRKVDIMNRWKDLQQVLQEQRAHVGDAANTFAVLRDIELISMDLKELQVNWSNILYPHTLISQIIMTSHSKYRTMS